MTSPARRSPVATVSSAAAAALGVAAATLRLLGLLSDVSLRATEKGKGVAGHDSDMDSDSDALSSASINLIRGMRRTRRSDYHPETDLALSGLAAYDLPLPVATAYCTSACLPLHSYCRRVLTK